MPRQPRRKSSARLADAAPEPSTSREFVQALERGFAVIKAFSGASSSLSMAEVAERTGLARAVARRYLLTLSELHCVQQHEGRFMLTPRVLDLGFVYLSTMSVASLAQQSMESVTTQLGESCSLSVLDGREVVYIARVPAKRIMSINLVVGSRLPAHATSMGKVLLAYLPAPDLERFFAGPPLPALTSRTVCEEPALRKALTQVRERGWALADGEVEVGIRSIAAPLWDRTGLVTAAINVSAPLRVSRAELIRHHLPVLLDAARKISKSLNGRPEEHRHSSQ